MTIKKISSKIKFICINLLEASGIHLKEIFTVPLYLPRYVKQYIKYCLMIKSIPKNLKKYYVPSGTPYIRLKDYKFSSGSAKGHYFNQDLLVANLIYNNSPEIHLDIGSRMDGFIAHLLSFDQKTVVADVRESEYIHPKLTSLVVDLTDIAQVSSINRKFKSISCLHTIEHFGLGRYGDKIDPLGHYNGLKNISYLLDPDGIMYLSHPTGFSRTEFNGHRVINTLDMIEIFDDLKLKPISLNIVDDEGNLKPNVILSDFHNVDTKMFNYALAIWTLKSYNFIN